MKILNTLKTIFRVNKLTREEMLKEWECDENIKNMQKDYLPNNPSKVALDLVEPGSVVLSCGCGAGREVKYLVSKGCKVTAIDNSQKMIGESQKIEPNARYYLADMLDYESEIKYDYIVCLWNTINYLPTKELRKQFINNCYNNLKDGGTLIIATKTMLANLGALARGILSNKNYYFWPSQIDYWFEGTNFDIEKKKIGIAVLITAKKVKNEI